MASHLNAHLHNQLPVNCTLLDQHTPQSRPVENDFNMMWTPPLQLAGQMHAGCASLFCAYRAAYQSLAYLSPVHVVSAPTVCASPDLHQNATVSVDTNLDTESGCRYNTRAPMAQ